MYSLSSLSPRFQYLFLPLYRRATFFTIYNISTIFIQYFFNISTIYKIFLKCSYNSYSISKKISNVSTISTIYLKGIWLPMKMLMGYHNNHNVLLLLKSRCGRCSLFLMMRCFPILNDAMFWTKHRPRFSMMFEKSKHHAYYAY